MRKILLLVLASLIISGCIEKKVRDLESPCVANQYDSSAAIALENPCIRRPANQWLI